MKLNHSGVYRIIGEQYELLANVVGEVPTLRITSALLMNDLIQESKFNVLTEESIEIQTVYANPDKFIFLEYEYSEICKLPPYRKSIRGSKSPDCSDRQLREFTKRYLEDIGIPGRGITATKAYIMSETDWTLGQINVLMMRISKLAKARYVCYPLFNRQSKYLLGRTIWQI